MFAGASVPTLTRAPSHLFTRTRTRTHSVRFVARSLRHLFATTYERSDELTLAALVSYLNAAMPPDKHEDFDTAEVSRAALALHAAGAVALAGDVLRPAP